MKAALFGLTLALAVTARAGPAHEHGQARLDVTVDPARVTLDLDIPLDTLVGFERAPRTDAERAAVDAALKRLRAAAQLFRIGGADCEPTRVELVSAALQLGSSMVPVAETAHADLNARYDFSCKAGARASALEVGLFDTFPALRRIDLQVATPKGQLKATLQRPASRVVLVR